MYSMKTFYLRNKKVTLSVSGCLLDSRSVNLKSFARVLIFAKLRENKTLTKELNHLCCVLMQVNHNLKLYGGKYVF